MSFLALLEVLNFDFRKCEPVLKSQMYQNSKLRVSKSVKMTIFDILIQKLSGKKIPEFPNSAKFSTCKTPLLPQLHILKLSGS